MGEERTYEVEIEELEIGNEAYAVQGTVTYTPAEFEEGEVVKWDATAIVGRIDRHGLKKLIELPSNRRARLLLQHGGMIREALIEKVQSESEKRDEEAQDRRR